LLKGKIIKNRLKHYIKEILSFIVVVILVSNLVSYYQARTLNKDKFNIPNISLNGKPILVHFWATWCPTCKLEASNIQNISKSYNVITIAVQSGSDKEIQKYLDDNNLDFKFINDKNSDYAKKFKVDVFPTTLIYDKNKNLIFSEVGYTSTLGLKLRMWLADN